jgi:hypothetical protein
MNNTNKPANTKTHPTKQDNQPANPWWISQTSAIDADPSNSKELTEFQRLQQQGRVLAAKEMVFSR